MSNADNKPVPTFQFSFARQRVDSTSPPPCQTTSNQRRTWLTLMNSTVATSFQLALLIGPHTSPKRTQESAFQNPALRQLLTESSARFAQMRRNRRGCGRSNLSRGSNLERHRPCSSQGCATFQRPVGLHTGICVCRHSHCRLLPTFQTLGFEAFKPAQTSRVTRLHRSGQKRSDFATPPTMRIAGDKPAIERIVPSCDC